MKKFWIFALLCTFALFGGLFGLNLSQAFSADISLIKYDDISSYSHFAVINDDVVYIKNGKLVWGGASFDVSLDASSQLIANNSNVILTSLNKIDIYSETGLDNSISLTDSLIYTCVSFDAVSTLETNGLSYYLRSYSLADQSLTNQTELALSGTPISFVSGPSGYYVLSSTSSYKYLYLVSGNNFNLINTYTENSISGINLINIKGEYFFVFPSASCLKFASISDGVIDPSMQIDFSENISPITGEIYSASQIQVTGSKLYILDSVANRLSSLTFGDEVEYSTLLAGRGREEGRFNEVSDLYFASSTLYVADTLNNRIQKISGTNASVLNISTLNPKALICDYDGNFFIYNGSNLVKHSIVDEIVTNHNILDLAIDATNTIFALDFTDQKVVKINDGLSTLTEVASLTFSANAKLEVTADGQTIYVLDGSTLTTITSTQSTQTLSESYSHIMLSSSGQVILASENKLYILGSEEISLETSLNNCAIDKKTGTIYCYNQAKSMIFSVNSDKIDHLNEFTYPNYLSSDALSESVLVGKLTTRSGMFEFSNNINCQMMINADSEVIILDDSDATYYYCLYSHAGTNDVGYILKSKVSLLTEDDGEVKQLSTNRFNVKIYKYPYSTGENVLLATLSMGAKVTACGNAFGYTDGFNKNFTQVTLSDGEIGYIETIALAPFTSEKVTLETNASISLFSNQTHVQVYADSGLTAALEGEKLTEAHEILVASYDRNAKATYIEYINENGVIAYGYISTSNVMLDEVAPEFFIASGLMVACIVLSVVLLIYAKNRKEKIEA